MKSPALVSLSLLFAMVACGGGSSTDSTSAPVSGTSPPSASTPTAPTPSTPAASKVNVFYSGHSLLDNPLPNHVESIAQSLGQQSRWNQQNIVGSPIRVRVKGVDTSVSHFPGYQTGKNYGDTFTYTYNMDVVAELRNPQTLAGDRYQAMVITENHNLPIDGEDTVRYLRHVHERLIEGNASATTYVYHSWQSFRDKNNPTPWIAYERSAAPVWQCIASRINRSLSHEGRTDFLQYLPAGTALVDLVERATLGLVAGMPSSAAAVMDTLFTDDVHLTNTGMYYMALVTYASIFKRSPVGAAVPSGIHAALGRSLQEEAWSSTSSYYANPTLPTLDACSGYMVTHFCAPYTTYINLPQALPSCLSTYNARNDQNPFWFTAATDAAYWFPAP